jgi:Spy/CpxP family protein refolding chaperone
MGLAKAAELNHYPGPKHVLDLADELELTDAQRAEAQAAREAMRSEAIPLGNQVVAKEATLDALFADGRATPSTVRALLREIAVIKADLRFAHLNAHLTMRDILTEQQIRRYDVLRGYASEAEHPGH